ncbi:hypothetical protein C5C47_14105, partial [Rathayibacter rathayi]
RYTTVSEEHDHLVTDASAILQALSARGYRVVAAESSYAPGNPYRGLHVLVQHADERAVEIQFHSRLSQDVKDRNHVDYEIERLPATPYVERAAAFARMVERSEQVPPPAGLDQLNQLAGAPVVTKTFPSRYRRDENESRR